MRKKFLLILGILLAILAIGAYSTYRRIPSNKTPLVENAMHKYLRETKGYQENEYKLQVEFHWESALFGQDVYAINVTFNDEQDVIYSYRYKTTEIYQKGVAPINGKSDKIFKHAETE